MTRIAAVIIVTATAFAWGCGTGPTTADYAKLRSLENRVSKLESELVAAHTARDQAVNRAKAAEDKLAKEIARGVAVEKERDDARAELRAKAAEREAVQAQLDGFRKNLKELLGQMEAVNTAAPVPTPTALGTGSAARGF